MITVTDAFKTAVYAPSRAANARMYFKIDGVETLYSNADIVNLKIIEELSIISDTVSSNELTITMDNTDGDFSFLTLANVDLIISKKPTLRVEIAIQLADLSYEWITMGTYTLFEWRNEIGSLTVTMIARDTFDLLAEVPYGVLSTDTLYNIAVDLMTHAGITSYSIDSSLTSISAALDKSYSSRDVIQLIATAGKCIAYQDRLGVINIKPLTKTGVVLNYYTYAGFGYVGMPSMRTGLSNYMIANEGYDIKSITYNNMYSEPKIKLEKPIYSITINGTTVVNTAVTSGRTVTMDNPLIAAGRVTEVATWIFAESAKTAVYETQWRQNPALE
jgi:hypothetical protein